MNWKPLKEIPELKEFNPTPPPLLNENTNISSTSGNRGLAWLIIWLAFHLFALLMSHTGISIFNHNGEYKAEKF